MLGAGPLSRPWGISFWSFHWQTPPYLRDPAEIHPESDLVLQDYLIPAKVGVARGCRLCRQTGRPGARLQLHKDSGKGGFCPAFLPEAGWWGPWQQWSKCE